MPRVMSRQAADALDAAREIEQARLRAPLAYALAIEVFDMLQGPAGYNLPARERIEWETVLVLLGRCGRGVDGDIGVDVDDEYRRRLRLAGRVGEQERLS